MLDRLLRGIAWGGALAAVACSRPPEHVPARRPADGALGPCIPNPKGPGECCPEIACYDPEAGAACPTPDTPAAMEAVGRGLGPAGAPSICAMRGPVAAPAGADGRCCYVVHRAAEPPQPYEGRPLVVEGALREAGAVARDDWT